MSERGLVFVALLVLAAAVVFHAFMGRYEFSGQDAPGLFNRFDRFKGSGCVSYTFGEDFFRDEFEARVEQGVIKPCR